MRRREFIALIGGGAVAWPLAAHAQQPAMPVVGFLHSGKADAYADALAGFRDGLKEVGYVEGQNVAIEYRWAEGQNDRLAPLTADLVHRHAAVILAGGGGAVALAARGVTSTVPIVAAIGDDPVKLGLVSSLARPGGNVTGVTLMTTELPGKRLELLRELLPQVMTVAYLVDPQNPSMDQQRGDALAAGRMLGQQIIVLEARSDQDFEAAFAKLVELRAGALVVGAFPLFTSNRDKLLALAARHSIPAVYQHREFVEAGGLVSYGADLVNNYRQGGIYAGRILKGAKPADLPFAQPTKFNLVINIKTVKTLGLTIPPALLARADEIIE